MREFVVGFMCGAIVIAIILATFGIVPEAKEAIAVCEHTLPRDQTCRLTAVPKELK